VINEQATVVAVSRDGDHRFSKPQTQAILLLGGFGVHGDAHAGTTVQHRSRVAADPTQPNLRQVHLLLHGLTSEEVYSVTDWTASNEALSSATPCAEGT
jgi:hypothetical protein